LCWRSSCFLLSAVFVSGHTQKLANKLLLLLPWCYQQPVSLLLCMCALRLCRAACVSALLGSCPQYNRGPQKACALHVTPAASLVPLSLLCAATRAHTPRQWLVGTHIRQCVCVCGLATNLQCVICVAVAVLTLGSQCVHLCVSGMHEPSTPKPATAANQHPFAVRLLGLTHNPKP
jgi:hypothetical protein